MQSNLTLYEHFLQQGSRCPERKALIDKQHCFTYAQLLEMVTDYTAKLQSFGIKKGNVVAIHLERSYELIVFQLAVINAGAIFLPVDKRYPLDRIQYLCNDCEISLFISDSMYNIGNVKTISLTEFKEVENSNCTENVFNDGVCYIIYTSGSTGNPKGCMLTGKGLVNFCKNNNTLKTLQKREHNIFACVNSVSFDYFIAESLFPLLNGYTVVLLDDEESISQPLFLNIVKKHGINVVMTTPTRLKMFYDDKNDCQALKQFDCICSAGEPLPSELLEKLYEKSPKAQVYNPLGPSECTVWNVGGGLDRMAGIDIHIGKPIANTQIYIVDKFMQLTPIGITGELCIAGDGVGAGYLNRPELTAEKFIDNPFGEGKLYKTGDLAYWREDGNIAYVGRNDFQVKIRGLRIELGEIENGICGIEGITQSVVVVRKNNEGRQLICAFYTGVEMDAKEIRNHIGKKLPKYMLPHIFTHINDMPLTSSGKVNRKALPEVDLYAIDSMVEYVAPITEQEKILATAIEDVLGIDKVGILDNFFDVGGDSLKAIELLATLEKEGYHTDTKTIFTCDTVKELAEKLTIIGNEEDIFEYVGDIPATAAQMRVYTAQSMESDSTIYNVPYAFKVGELDVKRLQEAVEKLIARHEMLRTHFENKDGSVIQVINNDVVFHVEQLDLDDISAFVRPFDLSKAPLFRVGYFENTIMIDMHHIITDGSSMPVFFHELNELYMGRTLNKLPVQYKQFAVQKHDYSKSEKYWLSVYNDELPILEINTDFKRGQKQSFKGNAIYDTIDIELHNKILSFCKEENITPYVFYMTGFNILLSKFSNNEDIVVGMPISGRGTKYLNTIGMFVNTIALRNKPVGTKTVREFLQEVKDNSILAIEHQDYPYGELVKKLNANTTERNPLFDVMFAYQSEQMTDVIFGDKQAEVLPIPITTSKYDFTFNIMPRDKDVVVMVEYCTDLYKGSTVHRLVNCYNHILEQLLVGEKHMKEINAIAFEEENNLRFVFNNTDMDYARDQGVYQLFEEQVREVPEKTAVIFKEDSMSYLELKKLVDRYADNLACLGVEAGDVVAIHLERSHRLVAFQFAVLKVGAIFLPVDKRYPMERICYMCGDCNVKILISDELKGGINNINVVNIDDFESMESDVIANVRNNIDVCYIIYTSGSTGLPKGCMLTSKGLVNFCKNNNTLETLKERENNIFACVNSVSFDYFIAESLLPLTNGYTTVVLDVQESTIQELFLQVVKKNKINVIMTTPTRLKIYFDDHANGNILKQLTCICTSGEPLMPELLVQMYKKSPDAQIYNPLGPSECTVWNVGGKLTREDGIGIHIGKPIANTRIYIVDKYMELTPIGVTGELCIAGDGVGVGYLNRPELTAEKFVDNPFGEGMLYKTGDLAYWREDGNIAYVGRNDFQVKIRGLRIELGEIENAICGIDRITQSVVVVRKNDEGRQLICAFYTGAEIDAKEIRNHIGKKLPKYMVPHIFTHINDMPLTSSGKVNRKALPEVDLYAIDSEVEYVPPESKQQRELCKLMEIVLGTTPIGITDDFFDAGGDSLKAIEFVSEAHSEGIYFSLQNVFDHPTVRELCEFMETSNKNQIQYDMKDFEEIHRILHTDNDKEHIVDKHSIGDILITGATGFLGAHIVDAFLENESGKVYCLVRGKDQKEAEERLKDTLSYYFGGEYIHLISDRIIVLCGDITKPQFGLEEVPDIHAAASVKHYGSYQYFHDINVGGTTNAVNVAKSVDAKFIQISTLSVSGNSMADIFDVYRSKEPKTFTETDLYIGQPLDNVYIRSKFEAEKLVYEEILNGLSANVIRVGNLTNRSSDYKFQGNYQSNAFLSRVKAVIDMGMLPEYLLDLYSEFSPVDDTANAIVTIMQHFSEKNIVFHVNNHKNLYFDRFVELAHELNIPMNVINEKQFAEVLQSLGKQEDTKYIYEALINDMDEAGKLIYDSNIHIENSATVNYLNKLNFEWTDIDYNYLAGYLAYFMGLGYIVGETSKE